MNRLKFFVFALAALGLWGYHLMLVSPAIAGRASEQATRTAWGAPAAVALRIESQRSALQAAVVRLGASPSLLNAGPKGGAKPEGALADRFTAVRTDAQLGLAEDLRGALVVAVVSEQATLWAQGNAAPAPPPEGFNAQEVARAGAQGKVETVFGAPHLFYSLPTLVSDKNEVKQAGSVLLGLPVLPDPKAVAEGVAAEFQLSGLALVSGGTVVASAGEQKALAEGAVKTLKAGTSAALAEGTLESLGPVALPMLVAAPAHQVAVRREITNTPWEVISVASALPAVLGLVAYQKFALMGLVGLLLLTAVVALVLRGAGADEEAGPAMVMPTPMPVPSSASRTSGLVPAPGAEAGAAPQPPAVPEHAPAPEASPDDFDFPMSTPSQASSPSAMRAAAHAAPAEPMSDPFAMAAPPPSMRQAAPPVPTSQQAAYEPPPPPPSFQPTPKLPPPSPAGLFDDDDAGARTMAYPTSKAPGLAAPPPGVDPFAMAAGMLSPEEQGGSDYNPDATRVAAVPQELLKASKAATGSTGERPALRPAIAPPPRVGSAPPPSGGAGDEERHFQDVYRDFVATREKCREPSDGLTYEKFKAKLVKNKEQLVQKYACRTVRFQVYVKDGKAALKATPVKD